MKRSIKLLLVLFVLLGVYTVGSLNAATKSNPRYQLNSLLPSYKDLKEIVVSREPEFYNDQILSRYMSPEKKNLFEEYGFKGLLVTGYFKRGRVVTVEIYKMSNSKAAYGIFNATRIPKDHDFRIGDGSKMSSSTLIFWQVSYVVKLISLGASEVSQSTMKYLAKVISKKIRGHSRTPYAIRIIPEKDLLKDSMRYAMGPIMLNSYFKFSPDGILDNKSNIGEAVIAEYKGKTKFSYCLLRYGSNWRSNKVLHTILAKIKKDGTNNYYLFDVLLYKAGNYYYKIDRIENYISIFKFSQKDFKYEWYLDRVREKIIG